MTLGKIFIPIYLGVQLRVTHTVATVVSTLLFYFGNPTAYVRSPILS